MGAWSLYFLSVQGSGWQCGGRGGSLWMFFFDYFSVFSGVRNKVISREREWGGGVESLCREEGVK